VIRGRKAVLLDGGTPAPGNRALQRRRREIEQRWADGGLKRATLAEAPRWLGPQAEARLRWLGPELEQLGPVFSSFGRYLSTRLDFVSGADGQFLATLPDRAEPAPDTEVLERLRRELGVEGVASLVHLDAVPIDSRALFQTHRARLADGRWVLVRLARAGAHLDEDLAVLPDWRATSPASAGHFRRRAG